jgi:hypothetical protein
MIDDNEARDLLARVVGAEPPLRLSSAKLLRRAQRDNRVKRGAMFGGVAVAVAVVVAASVAAVPRPSTPDMQVADPPETSDCVAAGRCRVYPEDEWSRALTTSIQSAREQFIPAGMTIRQDVSTETFGFVKLDDMTSPWPYVSTAVIGDSQGFGTVEFRAGTGGPAARCEAVDRIGNGQPVGFPSLTGCSDRTLTDGTTAAVSTYQGSDIYREVVVDAVRPNGTHLHLRATNTFSHPATIPANPLRLAPPLSADDLLKVARILQ